MRRMWAHCLVCNEARFVWYAVMSVLPFVDRMLVWDTGSTDGTWEILEEIERREKDKVDLRRVGRVRPEEFAVVRQEMLDATEADWFAVVDGDEIWWEDSIRKVLQAIEERGDKLESIVVPTVNLVGDMFHYQAEEAGRYHLAGRRGHLNLRAVNRRIPGLASAREHGQWGWVGEEGKMIQDRDQEKIVFVDAPYLHATHLRRAGSREKEKEVPKRKGKLKYELGIEFPRDFYYPEVFFRERPKIVPSVWERRSRGYEARAVVEVPLRWLKRRVWPERVGY